MHKLLNTCTHRYIRIYKFKLTILTCPRLPASAPISTTTWSPGLMCHISGSTMTSFSIFFLYQLIVSPFWITCCSFGEYGDAEVHLYLWRKNRLLPTSSCTSSQKYVCFLLRLFISEYCLLITFVASCLTKGSDCFAILSYILQVFVTRSTCVVIVCHCCC